MYLTEHGLLSISIPLWFIIHTHDIRALRGSDISVTDSLAVLVIL